MNKKITYNLVWGVDVPNENCCFRTFIIGKPIYDMKCNKCFNFIGAFHIPEDCNVNFCNNCGNKIKNDE